VKLRFAVLAEYANVTGDGKLNILGITDHLYAYNFPAIHRDLVVVNSLETENEDDGTKQEIRVQIIDPDGKMISNAGGILDIVGLRQVVNQVHVFQDLQFAAPGGYEVQIYVNNQLVKTLDLGLVQIPPQGLNS
jgi:hypothetical protein